MRRARLFDATGILVREVALDEDSIPPEVYTSPMMVDHMWSRQVPFVLAAVQPDPQRVLFYRACSFVELGESVP